MLQFYGTNLISTYCSIRNRIEYFLIQSMIEWTDKTHWNRLNDNREVGNDSSSSSDIIDQYSGGEKLRTSVHSGTVCH